MGCCLSMFVSPVPNPLRAPSSPHLTNPKDSIDSKRPKLPSNNDVYNQYQLFSKIGSGRLSKTYRAVDEQGRRVALKILSKTQLQTEEITQTVLNSNRKIADLDHQNIMQLYQIIETPTDIFLVLEYAEKGSVEKIIRNYQTLPRAFFRSVAAQLLNAIYFLHSHGIQYGEMSAKNVFIDGKGIVKLAEMHDFQGASFLDRTMEGTLSYLAPEVFQGVQLSVKSDVFSLGVLMYYCLYRRYPVYIKGQLICAYDDEDLDPELCDFPNLLKAMLEVNPKKRIGNSLTDFVGHPFFAGMNWTNPRLEKGYMMWLASVRTIREPDAIGASSNENPISWNANRSGFGAAIGHRTIDEDAKEILSCDNDFETRSNSNSVNAWKIEKQKSKQRLSEQND